MSIIHMDGFDSYATDGDLTAVYLKGDYDSHIATSAGRFGGGAFNASSGGSSLEYVLTGSLIEIWEGFAFNCQDGSNNDRFMTGFLSAAGIEACITYNPTQHLITAYRGNRNTSLGSAGGVVMLANTWHWIEVRYKMHASAGVVEVWVDGVRVLNLTGVNTSQGGGAAISGVSWATLPGSSNPLDGYYDDWYIADPTTGTYPLGDSRIKTLTPVSDAGPNDGTPDSGSTHYTQVNENQWSSAHNVTLDTTVGHAEMFGMNALGVTPYNISAVRVLVVAAKTDAGTCDLEAAVVNGGNELDGPNTPITAIVSGSTPYGKAEGIFEVDPATSAPWTAAAIGTMKCGVKVAS